MSYEAHERIEGGEEALQLLISDFFFRVGTLIANCLQELHNSRKSSNLLHETVVLRLECLLELFEGVGGEALAEHSGDTCQE